MPPLSYILVAAGILCGGAGLIQPDQLDTWLSCGGSLIGGGVLLYFFGG